MINVKKKKRKRNLAREWGRGACKMSGVFILSFSVLIPNNSDRVRWKQYVVKNGLIFLFSQNLYEGMSLKMWSGSQSSVQFSFYGYIPPFFASILEKGRGQKIGLFISAQCFQSHLSPLFGNKMENLLLLSNCIKIGLISSYEFQCFVLQSVSDWNALGYISVAKNDLNNFK